MAKLFDAEGKEVEAFTAEELEAQKKAALDAYIAANPDKSGDIAKLQDDLKKATEALAGAGGDDAQKKRLKEDKDAITKELTEKIDAITTDFKAYKDGITTSAKEALLGKLTNGDKDLRAKIEIKMNNLKGYPETPEGTSQMIQEAYLLATGNKPTPSMMDGITGGGARGEGSGAGAGNKGGMTENGKVMATALGIKDDVVKKYSDEDIAKAQGKTTI